MNPKVEQLLVVVYECTVVLLLVAVYEYMVALLFVFVLVQGLWSMETLLCLDVALAYECTVVSLLLAEPWLDDSCKV